MEITVAIAAPCIPISSQKIKIGSRITFNTAPIIIVNIAFFGYPEARITALKLKLNVASKLPGIAIYK